MPLVGNPDDWSRDTKQGVIAAALDETLALTHAAKDCGACDAVTRKLMDSLGIAPLIFRTRVGGEMVEMPRGRARAIRFRRFVYEVHAHMCEWTPETAPTTVAPLTVAPAPVATVRRDGECQRAADEMIRWIQRDWRPFCDARNADGKPFDQVGLRPAQNASKMLTAGIPVPAIKHALTLHYPSEARSALGVTAFDPTTFAPRQWGPVEIPRDVKAHSGKHRALPYVVALAQAGVPAALVGPPGTGKTTLAAQLAEELGRPFGMVSMTRGTSPSAFNGRPRIGSDGTDALVTALIARGEVAEALKLAQDAARSGDVAESQFVRIYRDGGVFLFDEMDASEPNLLLLVNAALANGHFANAATGEMVARSRYFVPIAGMNTLGLGGDRAMVGREKQDGAALDRWAAGRTEILLDADLERKIFWETVA